MPARKSFLLYNLSFRIHWQAGGWRWQNRGNRLPQESSCCFIQLCRAQYINSCRHTKWNHSFAFGQGEWCCYFVLMLRAISSTWSELMFRQNHWKGPENWHTAKRKTLRTWTSKRGQTSQKASQRKSLHRLYHTISSVSRRLHIKAGSFIDKGHDLQVWPCLTVMAACPLRCTFLLVLKLDANVTSLLSAFFPPLQKCLLPLQKPRMQITETNICISECQSPYLTEFWFRLSVLI